MKGQFIANVDDVRPQFRSDKDTYVSLQSVFNGTLVRSNGVPLSSTSINDLNGEKFNATTGMKQAAKPWYSDQILPFDITLAGASEYGACTAMRIFGVEILNEGSGVSIDDAVTEMQATFVARFVEPWQAVASPNNSFGGSKLSLEGWKMGFDLVLRGWVKNQPSRAKPGGDYCARWVGMPMAVA